jgi:ketosteroid isomerase-like protein
MKTRLLLTLVCSVISFASPVSAQQKNTSDQELRQVADGLARKLDGAWNNNDAAAAAALYTDDGVHASFYQTSHGRQAIEKSYAYDFQRWHPYNHITTVNRLSAIGNELRATGRWSGSASARDTDFS